MRSETLARDDFAVFTLTCPGNDSADERVHDIQLRGNLPLMIGSDVLAEISHADLLESWETAISLPLKDLNAMTTLAGKRLSEMLEENLDARPILYPTVPKGEERLRIALHSYNTTEETKKLIAILAVHSNESLP